MTVRNDSRIRMKHGKTPSSAVAFEMLMGGETFRLASGSRILMKIDPKDVRGGKPNAVYIHDGAGKVITPMTEVVKVYCTMDVKE